MASKLMFTFTNGLKMPAIGLGTWRAPDAEVEAALEKALEIGYRHIDAAPVYLNEKAIGKVLKKWLSTNLVKREELFITTKLPPIANRPGNVEMFLKSSLADLQLDYVDLYLIHTPVALALIGPGEDLKKQENGDVVMESVDHLAVWKKMEEMVDQGLTKSIGVSNFNPKQIQRILDNCTIKPVNNQVELHVYLQQHEMVDYCKEKGIIVTAYSPLGSKGMADMLKGMGITREIPDLMENPEIVKIAERLNKTPAQILLRYILERGVAAIPKSTNAGRLQKNIELFDFNLNDEDMNTINQLDQGVRVCDFAFFQGITNHPEFPW